MQGLLYNRWSGFVINYSSRYVVNDISALVLKKNSNHSKPLHLQQSTPCHATLKASQSLPPIKLSLASWQSHYPKQFQRAENGLPKRVTKTLLDSKWFVNILRDLRGFEQFPPRHEKFPRDLLFNGDTNHIRTERRERKTIYGCVASLFRPLDIVAWNSYLPRG